LCIIIIYFSLHGNIALQIVDACRVASRDAKYKVIEPSTLFSLWLISHQPAVLSQNNQQPASSTFLLQQISTNHQSNEQVV
jgi:hypothetical protein